MNRAEQLRAEMASNFDKKTFIELVEKKIRMYGSADFICDWHVGTELNGLASISLRDRQAAIDCARAEGFRFHSDSNSYGVKYICFTI